MSLNPFHADPAVRSRFEVLDAEVGPVVREAVASAVALARGDTAGNTGGIVLRSTADAIRGRFELTVDELLLLARPVAVPFARPPISEFFVGAVELEAETGNLIFGGNLEFVGAHIGNTVHGEGFVFARAFSRGSTIETICLGEAHPCAHCRQFLAEFSGSPALRLIDPKGHRLTLGELYPWPFDPDYLGARGVVAGEIRHPELRLGSADLPDAVAARLVALGRLAYVPYSKSPVALVLVLADGTLVGGTAIESVAFNPTMGPLQTALIDLFAHGRALGDIASAVIATQPGPIDYTRHARDLLAMVAPQTSLAEVAWA